MIIIPSYLFYHEKETMTYQKYKQQNAASLKGMSEAQIRMEYKKYIRNIENRKRI